MIKSKMTAKSRYNGFQRSAGYLPECTVLAYKSANVLPQKSTMKIVTVMPVGATVTSKEPKSSIIKRMAQDKKKVEEFFKNGDESQKPEGIQFVKPFSLRPARG